MVSLIDVENVRENYGNIYGARERLEESELNFAKNDAFSSFENIMEDLGFTNRKLYLSKKNYVLYTGEQNGSLISILHSNSNATMELREADLDEYEKFTNTLRRSYTSLKDWLMTVSIPTAAGGAIGAIYGAASSSDSAETGAAALGLGVVGFFGGIIFSELRERLSYRSLNRNFPALDDKKALHRILGKYVDYS